MLEMFRAATVLQRWLYVRSEELAIGIVLRCCHGETTVERELEEISSELCALAHGVDAGNTSIKEALSCFHIVLKMKQEKSPSAVGDFVNVTMVSGSASSTSATCHYEEQD